MTCGSAGCEAPALITALWPGNEIAVCIRCGDGLHRVAKCMGFTLHFGHLAIAAEPLAQEVEEWLTGNGPTYYDPKDGAISTPAGRRK